MGFLWYIIIGIAAGFLAGKIMRGGGFGVENQPGISSICSLGVYEETDFDWL